MAKIEPFAIGGRLVGPGEPTYIVAELSANHCGSIDTAKLIVREAAAAGADAVKLQTYTADTLTINVDTDVFAIQSGSLWDGKTLYQLYDEASMPWEWHEELMALARECGIQCFSSPFDQTAVDFLCALDVPAYKVASFELVDLGLLRAVAAVGKPVFLSTGMATFNEIAEAVTTIRGVADVPIALLRTNSGYPASLEEMNLRTLTALAESFGVVVGLSDHTLDHVVPVSAVALGAAIVEKHVTLSRAAGGPDAAFSLEPHEFAEMVRSVRAAEQALGRIHYGPTAREQSSLPFRRSLFVVKDVRRGDPLTSDNVKSLRPAAGLPPRHLDEILTRRAARDLPRGTPLQWDHVT